MLRAWDEHLAHRSLPRTLASRLRSAGFGNVRVAAHPLLTVDFDPASSYGPAVTPFIAAFVQGRSGISADEVAAWVDEQRTLGARGEYYFTLTQVCFTATKRS